MSWGPRDSAYPVYPQPYVVTAPALRGLRFSPVEYKHILLACGALIAAFTLSFLSPLGGGGPVTVTKAVRILLGATLAVVTGFFLHELMHKVVAQRYGAWAEFRSNRSGLILAILTGIFGIVFAAPGAVYIAGPLSREQNGRVSLAGPLTNFVIGLAFTGVWLALALNGVLATEFGEYISAVTFFPAYINVFLGAFNMVPIPPLDGSKVLAWNPAIWIAALAAIAIVFLGFFLPGFFLPLLFGP
jgi:Zn-dependent protease